MKIKLLPIVLLLVPCASLSAGEKPPDADAIISRLAEWANRIDNLRMVWTVDFLDLDGKPLQGKSWIGNRFKYDWIWCRDGRWRLRTIVFFDEDFRGYEVAIDNGDIGYSANYRSPHDPLSRPISLTLGQSRLNGERPGSRHSVVPLEGPWSVFEQNWLGDRLNAEAADLTWGTEKVGDTELPTVAIADEAWSPVYLLDPDHDYQPRVTRKGTIFAEENRVEEFREIEPGFWFPVRGSNRHESDEYAEMNHIERWSVETVEINCDYKKSDFEILPVHGTHVEDHFAQKSFTYGPGMPPDTLPSGLNKKFMAWRETGYKGPNPLLPPRAVSPWKRWTPILLAVALLVCLGFLGFSTYLRNRDDPHRREI